jgi:hypothetical protein
LNGLTAEQAASQVGGIAARGGGFECFQRCLGDQEVSQFAIAVIAAGCGVACSVTLGLGCAVCISSIGGIAAGTITHCIRVC